MFFEIEQVPVSGDDDLGLGPKRTREHGVVVRVSGDDRIDRRGAYDLGKLGVAGDRMCGRKLENWNCALSLRRKPLNLECFDDGEMSGIAG